MVRCRKCFACIKERRKLWMGRAIGECLHAQASGGRTWFVTLTFRSEPASEKEAIGELQRYFKRLRKGRADPIIRGGVKRAVPPAVVRYAAVTERGEENGRLHLHCLVHGDARWLQLYAAWGQGHLQARQVRVEPDDRGRIDPRQARVILYATKYIGKSGNRLIASLYYGRPGSAGTAAKDNHPSSSSANNPPTEGSPGQGRDLFRAGKESNPPRPAGRFADPTEQEEDTR